MNVISPHGLHTLEANISHDTTNHPAHQQHAAFTPACFALPSGTAPRKLTFHQGRASPQGTGEASSHASSLQNERFVRDFLQKSHVKSPKRAFRTRLPQKLTCQSPQNERFVRDFLQKTSGNTLRSTHITQPCQAVSRFQHLQTTPAHMPIPMSHSDVHLYQATMSYHVSFNKL